GAGRLDSVGIGADGDESPAIAFIANHHSIVMSQNALHDRSESAISRKRSIGETSVRQDQSNSAGTGETGDVRPDFRFHCRKYPRSMMIEKTLDRGAEVERKVGDGRLRVQALRLRLAGNRGGGEDDRRSGTPPDDLIDHRA